MASGRWHTRGRAIIYCAPNPATALLEVLVHSEVRTPEALGGFHFIKIEIPDAVRGERADDERLPADWMGNPQLTRAWGDRWLREERSAVLIVRSVLVPETFNALVNPRHPEAAAIATIESIPYPLDARLFAGAR